jgi:hypothetical protein
MTESIIHRKRISTARDLAEELLTIDETFPQTGDKYLEVNGDQVVCVEVVEKILSDKSRTHDIRLTTELVIEPALKERTQK